MLSFEYNKMFKNSYLEKHLRAAVSMLDKEPSHMQHDGEFADLHDAKETINNTQHKEEPCKHMKVKSTLNDIDRQRSSVLFQR